MLCAETGEEAKMLTGHRMFASLPTRSYSCLIFEEGLGSRSTFYSL